MVNKDIKRYLSRRIETTKTTRKKNFKITIDSDSIRF